MSNELKDLRARERFRREWNQNFAVSANAGSGKTTAISERLAEMALSEEAAKLLPQTAVVTFTKKAAAQIGQRARVVLLRRADESGVTALRALDDLERAFFGTIHSFCLLLAQRYGQTLGVRSNPQLVSEEQEEELWEEFVESDPMTFSCLGSAELDAFLRHVPLDDIFPIARGLTVDAGRELGRRNPAGPPPPLPAGALARLLALEGKGSPATRKNLELSKQAAMSWQEHYEAAEKGFLPLYEPVGSAAALVELARAWMAPLKEWLADAASALAAELAERYRVFRYERGVQTYADQIDVALSVLKDVDTLERIRADGWRIILDEAQDTDTQQFAVLTEIARPPGAAFGSWPNRGGEPPRPGHFCLVGDGQQAIYGARADIRNFARHIDAFSRGDGGELLVFRVTFRAPRKVIEFLNSGFPAAFSRERDHNLGISPAEGVAAPLLQVTYEPLESAPSCEDGSAHWLPLKLPDAAPDRVNGWQAEEARQLAAFFAAHGPDAFGVKCWGDVCVLAPRVDWLATTAKEFEKAGLKTALQIRRHRNGDHPAYAWLTGLLAVVCDPENAFEWYGVLREVFAISDALLAEEWRAKGTFRWETPSDHATPLCAALEALRPFVLRANDDALSLVAFVRELAIACCLPEKARALDPRGGIESELERLIASAACAGLEGAGPRQWWRSLLSQIDEGRPLGVPDKDAINLLTSHSAKGLEWPVVIPIGLWRAIPARPDKGLRLINEGGIGGTPRLYWDSASLPAETREARERERLRELARLLYVTFTRARRRLVLPWGAGFGGRSLSETSFVGLWGAERLIEALPLLEGVPCSPPEIAEPVLLPVAVETLEPDHEKGSAAPPLPRRVLPHQLGRLLDLTREARHEAPDGERLLLSARLGEEAIDYGIWWHETMEFIPWHENAKVIDAYFQSRLAVAFGFAERGASELAQLKESPAWRQLHDPRWSRIAELGLFAPQSGDAWIDGVIDLALHEPRSKEFWIIDWKTNRRRSTEADEAFLMRLREEYSLQLRAYAAGVNMLFPDCRIRLSLYSTALSRLIDVPA